MMIDRIFQKVKTFINTDGRGNFKPADFNRFLHDAIQERYEMYITEINQAVNRENRGLVNGGLENIPDRIREKLLYFLTIGVVTNTSGVFGLPIDLKYFDTLETDKGKTFEFCSNYQEFKLLSSYNASSNYPICIKVGTNLKVFPLTSIPTSVTYLRECKYPKWTYNVFQNTEIFNPSATDFQDVDMHISEEEELVKKVCFKFGVNLKEVDLQSALNIVEQMKSNKNNAS
jgi:hypothetical protein